MWYLLIVVLSGNLITPTSASFHHMEFKNKEACLKAQTSAKQTSSGSIGYLCISSETGEVVK